VFVGEHHYCNISINDQPNSTNRSIHTRVESKAAKHRQDQASHV